MSAQGSSISTIHDNRRLVAHVVRVTCPGPALDSLAESSPGSLIRRGTGGPDHTPDGARRGIAGALVDRAETLAFERSEVVPEDPTLTP